MQPIVHPSAPTFDDEVAQRLGMLLTRRSVSPKRLGPPSPTPSELEPMLQAALRAPDHGGLHPWRVIEFRSEARAALATIFEEEKRRRDPLASPTEWARAREHATRAPMLLGFVVSPKHGASVPLREQWLAAGAALCNLLNAAHQLGFGAIMLSGERCHDRTLRSQLGVLAEEFLAGFVSIGRIAQAPPERQPVASSLVWSSWAPETDAAGCADQSCA
ncbi:MAG TPA: nitroreductase [Burkholderiaceae bacterium]|nr:nitroreductase [Burkholderiaceae bacterium]